MKKFPVVLDIETKYTFRDFAEHAKLQVSVAALYDYKDKSSRVFEEKELNELFPILENASYVVGYNIISFDLPVLQPYYHGKVDHFSTFDILDDIKKIIGRRLALNDVAFATFGEKKSGHGLMAIDLFKEGRIAELKKYCMDDVMLTKQLFEHGARDDEINYLDENGKVTIKVDWQKYLEESGKSESPLTLPF